MTEQDLKKLKFTNIHWAMMSTNAQNGYMFGFLECKKQVEKLLKEEKNEKRLD